MDSDATDIASADCTQSPLLESSSSTGLSKSRLKKLQKRQRQKEKKLERKQNEKDAKAQKALAQGRDLQAEHMLMVERTAAGERKKRRQQAWDVEKKPLADASFQICLDCSFESSMTDKEISSLASQMRYCYSYNKNSPHPCLFAATSLQGATLELLQSETGFSEWPNRAFHRTAQSLEEHFKDNLSNVIYLTSDSETVITQLDNDKIYVIGGIVDRNRLKGAAFRRAKQLGVATAKLPLEDHLEAMASTPVLTCNHVFDILLKYREFGNDWGKALQAVLPSRKEAHIRKEASSNAATNL